MPRAVADADQRPMSPELVAPTLPDLRCDVLRVLASGQGAWDDAEVVAALDWWAPRRHDASRDERVRAVLHQGRELGVVVDGTLTGAGRALLSGDGSLPAVLAQSLPEQVDQLILQADLTAIVPGLPTPTLAELMRTMADAESTGAASIYRFSAESIRRALDGGRTSGELLGELSRRESVPQALAYLIEDVARRHAVLRIGSGATYLRCEDPVVLAGILADPRAAALGLFALSDTVLACEQPPEHVLERLRALGHSLLPEPGRGPAVEAPRRARGRTTAVDAGTSAVGTVSVTPALAAAAVRAIRANDRSDAPGPGTVLPDTDPTRHPVPTMGQNDVIEVLRSAIATDSPVWIGYADPTGVAGDRRVEPLRLGGGYLTALDLRSESITSFALARITGALPA
jgi:hypothetical protein